MQPPSSWLQRTIADSTDSATNSTDVIHSSCLLDPKKLKFRYMIEEETVYRPPITFRDRLDNPFVFLQFETAEQNLGRVVLEVISLQLVDVITNVNCIVTCGYLPRCG